MSSSSGKSKSAYENEILAQFEPETVYPGLLPRFNIDQHISVLVQNSDFVERQEGDDAELDLDIFAQVQGLSGINDVNNIAENEERKGVEEEKLDFSRLLTEDYF